MHCIFWAAQGQSWSLFFLGSCKYNVCSCSKLLPLCNAGCPTLTAYTPNYEDCNTSCESIQRGQDMPKLFRAHFVAFQADNYIFYLHRGALSKYILQISHQRKRLLCYWPSAYIWKPESDRQKKLCKMQKKRKHYNLPRRGSSSKELEMQCWSWQCLLLLVLCWC